MKFMIIFCYIFIIYNLTEVRIGSTDISVLNDPGPGWGYKITSWTGMDLLVDLQSVRGSSHVTAAKPAIYWPAKTETITVP